MNIKESIQYIQSNQDKIAHFGLAYFVTDFYYNWISIVVIVLAIVSKELYDKYVRNTEFNLVDLAVGILGVVIAIISNMCFKH